MANRKYSWKKQPLDTRDFKYVPNIGRKLPSRVDLRGICPPIYDQGQLGSCTSNAIGGLIQFISMREGNSFMPSRLFIYYNERLLEDTVSDDAGAYLRDGMKVIHNQGAALESLWPYDITQFAVTPPTIAYTNGLTHLVTSYHAVAQDALHIQTCLAASNPIVFGFTVYASFESKTVANTGVVPMPRRNEQILGGHAVLLVGYDVTTQRYIARNSWGTSWGVEGYFYMPFAYVHNTNLSSDFWTANVITN